jgi:hypothetical protein
MFDSTTVESVRIQRPSSTFRARASTTTALFTASQVFGRMAPMFDWSDDLFGDVAEGDRRQKARS